MENNKKAFVTLKSRCNYLSLKATGRRIYTKHGLIFNFNSNNLSHSRLGWTLPRYVGNAVVRNKLKRYCRVSARSLSHQINDLKLDINIVFSRKSSAKYKTIRCLEIEESVIEFISKYKSKNERQS